MATITGTINGADSHHIASLTGGDLRTGSFAGFDLSHQGHISGVVIGDTTSRSRDSIFVQGSLLDSTSLPLTLWDSTYIDGTYVDGTYQDSTYVVRTYNPIWINYSVWFLDSTTLVGTRLRTPMNPQVGQFYANMYAPDNPGRYEIRWRYQKDSSSYAQEIDEPFSVRSWGIDSDYT